MALLLLGKMMQIGLTVLFLQPRATVHLLGENYDKNQQKNVHVFHY